ncbi:MAG: C4-type zinc ribbon domain-containing protein [Actinomycetota bacterium]
MPGQEALLTLQELDLAIDRAVAREASLRAGEEVRSMQAQADSAEGELGELGLRLDELSRDAARFEHEIDSLTRKATDEERRLYDGSIANAKELASLQHDIDNLKRRRSDREDELLALMEIREGVEAEATTARGRSDALRQQVDRLVDDAERELARLEGELGSLRAERSALVPSVEPDVLELYEDLRRHKKGVGAAALVDGVCQGCHEQLSAVELDRLKRTDGVRRCEHCRRILIS